MSVTRCGDGVLDGGEACEDGECCDPDTCGWAAAGTSCGDTNETECDAADTCDGAGTCSPNHEPDGTICNPVDACVEDGTCAAGSCHPGPVVECDDGNPCTTEHCDATEGCVSEAAQPLAICETGFEKTLLDVNEAKLGKEKMVVKLLKGPALEQLDLGDPLDSGGTAYTVCLFDESGASVGALDLDTAGADCAGKPCWKALGDPPPDGKGYLYKDETAAANGVLLMKTKAGDAGTSHLQVKGKNDAQKGRTALPVGIAAGLEQSSAAVVAVVRDDGRCFAGEVDEVKRQDATRFKAQRRAD